MYYSTLLRNKRQLLKLSVYRLFVLEICAKEGVAMMTIEGLIAVVSLVLTAFGLGYTIGSNKSPK